MIIEEFIENGLIRRHSDRNVLMRQIETGALYGEAVDVPGRYTYEETDIPIEPNEGEEDEEKSEAEEILNIILGESE